MEISGPEPRNARIGARLIVVLGILVTFQWYTDDRTRRVETAKRVLNGIAAPCINMERRLPLSGTGCGFYSQSKPPAAYEWQQEPGNKNCERVA